MSTYDLTEFLGEPKTLDSLIIPPIEEEKGKEVLRSHGCKIEEHERLHQCTVFFPEGTTRIEIFFRLIHPRYRITLPDGYELRATYDRYQNINILFYPPEQPETTTDI